MKNVFIDDEGEIKIGKDVLISNNVSIYTHNHEENKYKWSEKLEHHKIKTKLVIEDNVFIGHGAIILSTCKKIGKNSIIGAGTVITHDIPKNQVWAGNPAIKIRDRQFDGEKDTLCQHQ
jgi:acetyltransferase-like isoleucine patch superfamily enzyme